MFAKAKVFSEVLRTSNGMVYITVQPLQFTHGLLLLNFYTYNSKRRIKKSRESDIRKLAS